MIHNGVRVTVLLYECAAIITFQLVEGLWEGMEAMNNYYRGHDGKEIEYHCNLFKYVQ